MHRRPLRYGSSEGTLRGKPHNECHGQCRNQRRPIVSNVDTQRVGQRRSTAATVLKASLRQVFSELSREARDPPAPVDIQRAQLACRACQSAPLLHEPPHECSAPHLLGVELEGGAALAMHTRRRALSHRGGVVDPFLSENNSKGLGAVASPTCQLLPHSERNGVGADSGGDGGGGEACRGFEGRG
eukprot:CAMPEP_0181246538 /NCGR_PEP_ID=MMETSP1096-20121128/44055_1 /TAXON_ID=156174 ORGANISM="Chrysochromulina ericina, Strain CCMP281" /NCGR_SAMPLE_ID=MMETSP1096 /ASSEMBLY_ACC=CAM_ASM_000453 /LENGTH=185 /DNA_ID=CAMNT_0023343377 /DNA_START=526 /DNA_END=1085 /DNA_ORIENTATION=+